MINISSDALLLHSNHPSIFHFLSDILSYPLLMLQVAMHVIETNKNFEMSNEYFIKWKLAPC